MKCVILSVHGDEHGILEDCDYAVLELDGLAEYLRMRMGQVKKLQKRKGMKGLQGLTFADAVCPLFFGTAEAERLFGNKALTKANSGEVVVAESKADPDEAKACDGMTAVTLEVTSLGALWVAVPRHAEFTVETTRVYDINLHILEEAE